MKKTRFAFLMILFLFLLSSCGQDFTKTQNTTVSDCQRGFMGVYGNKIYPSPDGYYFFAGNYLMFTDPELKNFTFVCNKAECLHAAESPENRINCDAFFSGPRSLSYENEKLYVLCQNLQNKQEDTFSIYETDIDGSNRNAIYTSGDAFSAFCLHQGNVYTSEVKLTDEDGNFLEQPMVTISRFPLKHPKDAQLLFQEADLRDGDINRMKCYGNYCYFDVVDFYDLSSESKKINLDTLDVSDCFLPSAELRGIGKDRFFYEEITENNSERNIWKSRYWQLDKDEEKPKELTKESFSAIEKQATLLCADDQYVYFYDIMSGENAVPVEQQSFYIYTYEGELIDKVPFGEIQCMTDYYPGDDRYLFLYQQFSDEETGETRFSFHYLDKKNLNGNARFQTMFQGGYEEYCGAVIY